MNLLALNVPSGSKRDRIVCFSALLIIPSRHGVMASNIHRAKYRVPICSNFSLCLLLTKCCVRKRKKNLKKVKDGRNDPCSFFNYGICSRCRPLSCILYSISHAFIKLYCAPSTCSMVFYPLLVFQKDLVFKNVNRYLVLNTVLVKQKENLYKNNVPVRMLK